MPKKLSQAQCFAAYGLKRRNPRWSWSARSEDGKTVAVTLWQDRFSNAMGEYRPQFGAKGGDGWISSPGHRELMANLAWARDNLDGEVRVIIAIPEDSKAVPRSIKECFPKPELRMRVAHIDDETGDFRLERIH